MRRIIATEGNEARWLCSRAQQECLFQSRPDEPPKKAEKKRMFPKVKVCGLTREADVADALELGVDYYGFNFAPKSPRRVDPGLAAPWVRLCGPERAVGVFVDCPLEELRRIVEVTGIGLLQLHGSEDAAYAAACPRPVIRALPQGALAGFAASSAPGAPALPLPETVAFLLFDTAGPGPASRSAAPSGAASRDIVTAGAPSIDRVSSSPASGSGSIPSSSPASGPAPTFGGTGKTFDWTLLRGLALPRPYFLAGGLGPDNVVEALRTLLALDPAGSLVPHALDLNSKLETAPGRKDRALLARCLQALEAFRASEWPF